MYFTYISMTGESSAVDICAVKIRYSSRNMMVSLLRLFPIWAYLNFIRVLCHWKIPFLAYLPLFTIFEILSLKSIVVCLGKYNVRIYIFYSMRSCRYTRCVVCVYKIEIRWHNSLCGFCIACTRVYTKLVYESMSSLCPDADCV